MPERSLVLEMRHITERFPGIVANDDIGFDLVEGEVHALLGENGAGKSTLMNILYGLYHPDEGEILIRGKQVRLGSPSAAIDAGVGMVHQHFMLIPVMTVAENIVLAQEPTTAGVLLDIAEAEKRVEEISDRYGLQPSRQRLIDLRRLRNRLHTALQRRAGMYRPPRRPTTGTDLHTRFGFIAAQRRNDDRRIGDVHQLMQAKLTDHPRPVAIDAECLRHRRQRQLGIHRPRQHARLIDAVITQPQQIRTQSALPHPDAVGGIGDTHPQQGVPRHRNRRAARNPVVGVVPGVAGSTEWGSGGCGSCGGRMVWVALRLV